MPNLTLGPLHDAARFRIPGFFTWGGSLLRADDGRYHLYCAAWAAESGHEGWKTHSHVVHAIGEEPCGPFTRTGTILAALDEQTWDCDNVHNPTVLTHKGRYYLYYTGSCAPRYRNAQQIGVAVADDPAGPFLRQGPPILTPGPAGAWDDMICMNPSVCRTPDDRFVMIYKAASHDGPPPMFGPVRHGVAFADSPLGPFTRHPEPIFTVPGVHFPYEDPFVWHQDGCFWCILKDMQRHFSEHERALVLFTSPDAIDWTPAAEPIVCTRSLVHADGSEREYHRVERPQLLLIDGIPRALSLAVKPHADEDNSWNVRLPIMTAEI